MASAGEVSQADGALDVFRWWVREIKGRIDEYDITQHPDALFVTLLPEESNDFLEQDPVDKNALPGFDGKFFPLVP